MIELIQGDCLEVMRGMDDNSVDSVVTDPPYGLSFMGKKWDYDVPSVEIWAEVLRVLKPGGHLLSFGGTRTYHRMVVNIEDAGFEIRDQLMWVYGSGFPKSHNVSKAIDKMKGAEREVVGKEKKKAFGYADRPWKHTENANVNIITAPATPEAEQWDGWGTALKPANEPICLARKPFSGTVAGNVLEWGTGGLNVDGCRVEGVVGFRSTGGFNSGGKSNCYGDSDGVRNTMYDKGRFPANIILDEEAGRLLDEQSGVSKSPSSTKSSPFTVQPGGNGKTMGDGWYGKRNIQAYADTGGASRFFYCAKTSRSERNAGMEGMEEKLGGSLEGGNDKRNGKSKPQLSPRANHHPTVKPLSLMRYLCRLITPPNGVILDPFAGSGSTMCGATLEGFSGIGIELSADYVEIARRRVKYWEAQAQPTLL